MNSPFKIKSYGFGELAQLYNDASPNPATAARWLRREITINPDLVLKLREAGHHKGKKLLTPREPEISVKVPSTNSTFFWGKSNSMICQKIYLSYLQNVNYYLQETHIHPSLIGMSDRYPIPSVDVR